VTPVGVLAEIWAGLDGDPAAVDGVAFTGADPVLPSVYAVGTAAAGVVAAATLAAARLWHARRMSLPQPVSWPQPQVTVDTRAAAVAFRSERYLRVDGVSPQAWDELSGDYASGAGWVRLHCNYPNHRDAALRALGLPPDANRAQVATEVVGLAAVEVEEAVVAAGGAAAALRLPAEWLRHPQSAAVAALPLVDLRHLGPGGPEPLPAAPRPLAGVRVLDLTRVIAGPVAGRTLAAHGAEVLRVGADHLPLVPPLVIDTGFGKRFCHLDLRSPVGRHALKELVAGADVVVQSFRPGALIELGFGPAECAAIRPGLVYVDVSAWGHAGPWRGRRGFDSLVQMAAGIADVGRVAAGDPDGPPRPLPAQVLDHATGFLAAAGAIAGLQRRHELGGSWHVRVSLARTALWLDRLGRVPGGDHVRDPGPEEVADLLDEVGTPFGRVRHVRPPGSIEGASPRWDSPPHPPGADPPEWVR
jgi:hypothetical protein